MPEMSRERLEQIRRRCEAATEGPWGWDGHDLERSGEFYSEVLTHEVDCGAFCLGGRVRQTAFPHDRDFIAAARTDVPDLLAHIEAQDAEIARLREALARMIFEAIDEAGSALEFLHGRDDLKDEIAALLRTEGERVEGCPACGGRMAQARPRYPRGEPRTVCPTCLADRIDNARSTLDPRTYEAGHAPTGAKEG